MKNLKKALALLMSLAMVLVFAACGADEPAPPSEAPETAPVSETPEAEDVELVVFAAASMEVKIAANFFISCRLF